MQDRLFRALLRLLPAEFRSEHASDMWSTFEDERREARGVRVARLWALTAADVVCAAPSEHWDVLSRDVRFALRSMAARPTATATAVVTLALAIGANVAMYGVVRAVLLAPLGYRDADRLVVVQEQPQGKPAGNVGYPTFVDLDQRVRSFDAMAAGTRSTAILSGGRHDAERISAMRVSASWFDMIGVQPSVGRAFTRAEDRPGAARRVTILSDALWRRRFNGDPAVLGMPLDLGGTEFTVVGVMPASFSDLVGARLFEGAELWTPLGYDPAASYACRTCRHLRVFGRLAPGVDAGRAEEEVSSTLRALAREYPREYDAPSGYVRTLRDHLLGPVRPVLLALSGGVFLLLLAACANVGNLLLMRASERRQEMAVRVALGVTRLRLIRQLLTEGIVLAVASAALGVGPAWLALRAVAAWGPREIPRLDAVALDLHAVLAAVGLATLSSLAFGLAPLRHLLRSADEDATARSSTDDRATWRSRGALVGVNVAGATVLVVGALLLVRTLQGLLAVPLGFEPKDVLTLRVDVHGPPYDSDDPKVEIARVAGFYSDLLARVRALPSVADASAVTTLPLGGDNDGFSIHVVGRPLANPEEAPDADRFVVQPRFFETLGIQALRGRVLSETDGITAPRVVVVNRTLADQLFGGDALGQQVRLGPPDAEPLTIVGVVADVKHHGLDAAAGYQVYAPHAQWEWAESTMTLVVRSKSDAALLADPVRRVVRELDDRQPVTRVIPYTTVVNSSFGTRRFAAGLLAAFGALALLLAALSVYGALGVLVRQRQREIGIRLALGATGRDVGRLVLRQGLIPVVAGLTAGLVLATAGAQLLSSLLFSVEPADPASFATAGGLLLLASLLAAAVPAWRASTLKPTVTLRA